MLVCEYKIIIDSIHVFRLHNIENNSKIPFPKSVQNNSVTTQYRRKNIIWFDGEVCIIIMIKPKLFQGTIKKYSKYHFCRIGK